MLREKEVNSVFFLIPFINYSYVLVIHVGIISRNKLLLFFFFPFVFVLLALMCDCTTLVDCDEA